MSAAIGRSFEQVQWPNSFESSALQGLKEATNELEIDEIRADASHQDDIEPENGTDTDRLRNLLKELELLAALARDLQGAEPWTKKQRTSVDPREMSRPDRPSQDVAPAEDCLSVEGADAQGSAAPAAGAVCGAAVGGA